MAYENFDLRQTGEEPPPPPPPLRSQAAPRILAALLIAAVAVTGYFVFRSRDAANSGAPETAQPLPSETPASALGAEAEAIDLPPLDESDPVVRELVSKLSTHPSVTTWLATDNLIRSFVAVVSNIASGEHATVHVPALKPRGTFLVEERGEDLVISPRSYARYLPLATAASSADPADIARLYTTLRPRLEDAYRELGYPDTPFDRTLERAIVVLLSTPVPAGEVPVGPAGANAYAYADPALEALSPAQKLLIRFGPDNARAVQSSLRNIALALGIPPERLP